MSNTKAAKHCIKLHKDSTLSSKAYVQSLGECILKTTVPTMNRAPFRYRSRKITMYASDPNLPYTGVPNPITDTPYYFGIEVRSDTNFQNNCTVWMTKLTASSPITISANPDALWYKIGDGNFNYTSKATVTNGGTTVYVDRNSGDVNTYLATIVMNGLYPVSGIKVGAYF